MDMLYFKSIGDAILNFKNLNNAILLIILFLNIYILRRLYLHERKLMETEKRLIALLKKR